ncbi:MAG: hypothetical protein JNK52_06205 [Zoogloeaceae bacterium]|nr:hypothetical protein [Zoogloeaceae bacterium]
MQRSAKLTLILLALVCTLPIIASYLTYYVWKPQTTMNYGELIQPAPLPEASLNGLAGQPGIDRAALNGHWTLVYAGSGNCAEACGPALYAMRQSRLAQGKEMERVARLWLVTDDVSPAPEIVQQHPALRIARGDPAWLARLPAAEREAHLFLVDPLGNVMMRFPAEPDVKLVIKDLQRLLKYSGLG